jgi:hypothetical protein
VTGPQEIDTAALRARYPDVFDRPASARLATPAMIVAALAILIYGLVDLDFSPSRFVAGLSQLGWISLMMIPPDPGSSLMISRLIDLLVIRTLRSWAASQSHHLPHARPMHISHPRTLASFGTDQSAQSRGAPEKWGLHCYGLPQVQIELQNQGLQSSKQSKFCR